MRPEVSTYAPPDNTSVVNTRPPRSETTTKTMCDATQEDLRALAQAKASMLLERDRIGTEGWLHSAQETAQSGDDDDAAEQLALRKENQALKKENDRLAVTVADLNEQLEHMTAMVSRMMAAASSSSPTTTTATAIDPATATMATLGVTPTAALTTSSSTSASTGGGGAATTTTTTTTTTATTTPTGFPAWSGSHPWTSEEHSYGGGGGGGAASTLAPSTSSTPSSSSSSSPISVVRASIPNAHGSSNVLCCRLHPLQPHLVCSGGADSTLRVHDWRKHVEKGGGGAAVALNVTAASAAARTAATKNADETASAVLRCAAPVLAVEWQPTLLLDAGAGGGGAGSTPSLLVVGCMDGSLTLASVSTSVAMVADGGGGSVSSGGAAAAAAAAAAAVEEARRVSSTLAVRQVACKGGVFAWGSSGKGGKQAPHKKYVTCVKWSYDGTLLASSSADRTVKLWRFSSSAPTATGGSTSSGGCGGGGSEEDSDEEDVVVLECGMECVKTWHFEQAVEALAFVGGDRVGDRGDCVGPLTLIMAPRGHHSLTYVNMETMREVDVPLNQAAWDKHVSFNVLHLEPSPDQRYLLASTDANKHIVYPVGGNQHVRLLAGHASDPFAKPKASWWCSPNVTKKNGDNIAAGGTRAEGAKGSCSIGGEAGTAPATAALQSSSSSSPPLFVASNSQGSDGGNQQVLVFTLASQRISHRLDAHSGQVRDVSCHASEPLMCSASYDHTVKVWSTF